MSLSRLQPFVSPLLDDTHLIGREFRPIARWHEGRIALNFPKYHIDDNFLIVDGFESERKARQIEDVAFRMALHAARVEYRFNVLTVGDHSEQIQKRCRTLIHGNLHEYIFSRFLF